MNVKPVAFLPTLFLLVGTAWAMPFPMMPLGSTANAPATPTHPAYEDSGVDTIMWTWWDQSFNEAAFAIYAGPGAEAPESPTHHTIANQWIWRQDGLTPNTLHTMRVSAENEHGESAKSKPVQAWTLAATPLAPVVHHASRNSLTLHIAGGDGNPSHTEYAVYLLQEQAWLQTEGSRGVSPAWQTAVDWGSVTVSGLAGAHAYEFQVRARNATGTETPDSRGTVGHTHLLLRYSAASGGSVGGQSEQTIAHGADGAEVTALPAPGAVFHRWNDGLTTAHRIDTGMWSDFEVSAHFRSEGGVDIDWYAGHDISPGAGQTWADLDRIDWTGKGMTLWEDFIAGTNPNDPRSRFAAESPVMEPSGAITLRWSSVPGRSYGVQWSHNLADWHDLRGSSDVPLRVAAATGSGHSTVTFADPSNTPGAPLFFRVRVFQESDSP